MKASAEVGTPDSPRSKSRKQERPPEAPQSISSTIFSFLAPFSPLIFFSALILGLTSFLPGSSESESIVMTVVALRFFALELGPALPFEGPAAAAAAAGWAISEAARRSRVSELTKCEDGVHAAHQG